MLKAAIRPAVPLLLLSTALFAGPSKLSARLTQARYVALGYDLGDRFAAETEVIGRPDRVLPEDRAALSAVRSLIEKWDRYVITPRPEEAEMFIAVRAARRVATGGAVRIGRSGERSASSGLELSSPDDMLTVYDASAGRPGVVLWRGQRPDGFSTSRPVLVEEFKAAVERAPKQP
jgi:hypothetical protein